MPDDKVERPTMVTWALLVGISLLLIGLAVFGTPVFVFLSSGDVLDSPIILFQIYLALLYTPAFVLVITALLIGLVKLLEGSRKGFWRWLGIGFLALMLVWVLAFVNTFLLDYWNDILWAGIMAGSPQLLPFIYVYAYWHRMNSFPGGPRSNPGGSGEI